MTANESAATSAELILRMMEYERGCPARIQHFLKVLAFSELIGGLEGMAGEGLETLKIAAVTHDIGIRPSIEKYGSKLGPQQEKEGPPVAREMLTALGVKGAVVDRVCYLISRHHTYTNIDGLDYQILVEADFLVNLFEKGVSPEGAMHVREKIFRTESGKRIFDCLFPPSDGAAG